MKNEKSTVLKPCQINTVDKEIPSYPSWIMEELETPSDHTDSDSAFQALFRMIEQNEFDGDDEENSTRKSESQSGIKKSLSILSDKSSSVIENRMFQRLPMKEPVLRTTATRPTLFMKSMQSAKSDNSFASKGPRQSSLFTGKLKDRKASVSIMMLQTSQAENIEPIYRKKHRIYWKINAKLYNKEYKSNVRKIQERICHIFNKDGVYINDRDFACYIEKKLDKYYKKKKMLKIDMLKLPRRLWGSDTHKPIYHTKHLTDHMTLAHELNYDMPHHSFDTDINKYVKRLKEIAEKLFRSSMSWNASKTSEIRQLSNEYSMPSSSESQYLFIPTEENFNLGNKSKLMKIYKIPRVKSPAEINLDQKDKSDKKEEEESEGRENEVEETEGEDKETKQEQKPKSDTYSVVIPEKHVKIIGYEEDRDFSGTSTDSKVDKTSNDISHSHWSSEFASGGAKKSTSNTHKSDNSSLSSTSKNLWNTTKDKTKKIMKGAFIVKPRSNKTD